MTGRSSAPAPGRARRPSLRRSDFRRITAEGRRSVTGYFLVFQLERSDGRPARLGITVTRKVGNAVRRNRIKRLVREWFRARQEQLLGCDVVVIVKRDLPQALDLATTRADLDQALPSPEPA